MPHLFLGSAELAALPTWLQALPFPVRNAVLIPTAARPMPSAPFVPATERLLRSLNLTVTTLDLADATPTAARRTLDTADLVYFTGGYAFYLLQHVHRTGITAPLTEAVTAARTAYAGISAGATLAGPDITPLSDPSDPGSPATASALNLVPFVVLPHRDRPRPAPRPLTPHPVLAISDAEAVVVAPCGHRVVASV
ncbi:Type 1 glutamine amidotransferase-like domain-containing protein [Actinocorallia sp. A-T 12471]|uniref:Type 1 glutamine amidotransferase-like domain-containing protein n=1 Tax=Actinocorallia sp. A-T 12471 TaxID=3089813 RepID=UPI0029D02C89|nr:Type 1 glutamine amidotransferase-like domain-containing protein [Actinocorallia sp. A-T 12471]MDX6740789.1 Type 1 glutamine amidotransferase-like domain-containing protein [Actinocorallia sp. A-T 12471]